MKTLRWLIFTLLLSIVGYIGVFWLCCNVEYNNRPLVYLWSDYYAPNGGPSHLKSMEWNSYCEKYTHWDAVVLGASRAERGYDPLVFSKCGKQIFNFGTSAQSMQNTHILVDQILSGACTTDEIWIDIFPASFKDDALESSADLIQNIGFVEAPWWIAKENRDFRMVNLLLKRFFCTNEAVDLGKAQYQFNGYVSVDQPLPIELKKQAATFQGYQGSDLEIGSKSLSALESIIENCEKHQVKCRLIISPVSVFALKLELERMLSAIDPIVKAHQVSLINLSKQGNIETTLHFYDEKHLNKQGVLLFNGALLEKLDR